MVLVSLLAESSIVNRGEPPKSYVSQNHFSRAKILTRLPFSGGLTFSALVTAGEPRKINPGLRFRDHISNDPRLTISYDSKNMRIPAVCVNKKLRRLSSVGSINSLINRNRRPPRRWPPFDVVPPVCCRHFEFRSFQIREARRVRVYVIAVRDLDRHQNLR